MSPPTVADRNLDIGTRIGMRLRHTGLLAREVGRFSSQQGVWWLIPVVTVLALFAAAVTTTTTALPVAVYALF